MSLGMPAGYAPDPALLQGRTVLVTGAGDGLGRALSIACAKHGATVVLLGRTVKKLEAVYDAIRQAGGPEPAIYPMHLGGASWNDHEQLAATLEREFGQLDGLVHCAVHFKAFSPFAGVEARDWHESLQVNLTAPFTLTRLCLPLLEKSGHGSVVFVSDAAGRSPRAFQGPYGVAKAALENLAAAWAQELQGAGRVRINTFDPGPMRTAHRLKGYPGEAIGKAPLPDAAVARLLWMLSNDSSASTGMAF